MRPPMRRLLIVLGSIVGVLVIAVAAGLFVLDAILTSQAQKQAAALSKQLGRRVRISSIATKLFKGLAVRVSGIELGPASGEKLPLVQVGRVEVKAALMKAIKSKGKQVEIKSAEVEGLTVNVIRLEDGTTNLERLQQRLAEQAEKEPKKPEPPPRKGEKPADLSMLVVDHLALLEGRVRFIDESGEAAKKLEIQHLSVVINDLRAGKPLDVVVKAAVLAAKENFELRVHAAPLPPTLQPTPQTVTLKIQPIDLAPIAPFVPKSVGLQEGSIDADFTAKLGAAVPGGSGRTELKGVFHATGMKFAGQEGGKALDVSLEADLDADARAGDVDIKKLKLDFGPAGITGSGGASGLLGPSPRVEGLQIVSHDLDPARLAALYPPLKKQLKGQIAGPIGITVRGSGSQAAQNVELKIDLTPVRLNVPLQLTKAAGATATVVAHAKGSATGGELAFDAKIDLSGVDLRPGQAVNKAPGQPLEIALDGTKSGGEKGSPLRVELKSWAVRILDAAFSGNATVEMTGEKKKFDLTARCPSLDVDKLLIESKAVKKEKPPPDPAAFAGLEGRAEVRIDKLRVKKQEVTNVVAETAIVEDDLTVKTAELRAFGGTVSASGTRMKLAHPDDPFHAELSLKNIDLAKGLALVSDKKMLAGGFNGDIALDGKGQDPKILQQSLAGLIKGSVENGQFFGKDVIASVAGPLASKLPFGVAGKGGQGGATSLGKLLPFGLEIADGRARLKQPLKIARPEAGLTIEGGITLEGMLEMSGTAELSPQLISTLTAGKAKVPEAVPIKFSLGGPAWKPEVTGVDVGEAVKIILKHAASGIVGKYLGGAAGKKAQEIIEGGREKAEEEAKKAAEAKAAEARKAAEDRLAAERKKVEAKARAEADKQKKRLEEEAKKRLRGLFGN